MRLFNAGMPKQDLAIFKHDRVRSGDIPAPQGDSICFMCKPIALRAATAVGIENTPHLITFDAQVCRRHLAHPLRYDPATTAERSSLLYRFYSYTNVVHFLAYLGLDPRVPSLTS